MNEIKHKINNKKEKKNKVKDSVLLFLKLLVQFLLGKKNVRKELLLTEASKFIANIKLIEVCSVIEMAQ